MSKKTRVKSRLPNWLLFLTVSFLTFAAFAENNAASMAAKGEKLYIQFSLFYIGDTHRTTNYRKGTLVPINTEVEFIEADDDVITVRIPDFDAEVKFENEEDYSGENIDGIFKRTFGRTKVDLSKFTEPEQAGIKRGVVEVGMSKDAVIKAIGYPPRHKTASLKLNQWRYWHNKFDTFLVSFENDKVAAIKE